MILLKILIASLIIMSLVSANDIDDDKKLSPNSDNSIRSAESSDDDDKSVPLSADEPSKNEETISEKDSSSTSVKIDFIGTQDDNGEIRKIISSEKETVKVWEKHLERLFNKGGKSDSTSQETENDQSDDQRGTDFSASDESEAARIRDLVDEADGLRNENDIGRAIEILTELTENGNAEAINYLGEIYLRGEFGAVDQDVKKALEYFNKSAGMGDPFAHHNLAVLYESGIVVERRDSALALLHDYFSSIDLCIEAQMSMGFRHMFGKSVPKSCKAAVKYYQSVAEQTIEQIGDVVKSGVDLVRLSDEEQRNAALTEDQDVINYLRDFAEGGDRFVQLKLGRLYYYGARGVPEDVNEAARYFNLAADQNNAAAMAHLGHMYLAGNGVKQDNSTAFEFFRKAIKQGGDSTAYNGLGYMYLHGIGTKKNFKQARISFEKAASAGNADSQYHLGNMFYGGIGMGEPDYSKAIEYYTLAGANGHTTALNNLAKMHLHGRGALPSCHMALRLFKTVSERGPWADMLSVAHKSFLRGDFEQSLMIYIRLAEEGFEVAQHNAGWLFDQEIGYYGDDHKDLAFRYFSMSADQGNAEAQRILGDYHYYEMVSESAIKAHHIDDGVDHSSSSDDGVDHSSSSDDSHHDEYGSSPEFTNSNHFTRASRHYIAASNLKDSQSSFNLGYMHQFGIGLPQDFHMAKRYYDTSFDQNSDAYIPVTFALISLDLQEVYNEILSFWEKDVHIPQISFDLLEDVLLFLAVTGLVIVLSYRLITRRGLWND